ncbi:MAG: Fmu (Sun) domain-containing protein [Chitinophagaceae bacterium]|nr:Fmu (Sun) domain-containing protein [Chitinophagaceae bacterium]
MSRYYSYINSAAAILSQYHGEEPFASFSKKYFAQHKKFGSRDRKQITHLCYCYFRLGKALPEMAVSEKILAGLFLCSHAPDSLLETVRPEWNEKVMLPLGDKLQLLSVSLNHVFPWADALTDGIDGEQLSASYFTQPGMFLRLRPGREAAVKGKLEKAGIGFSMITDHCMALSNATSIDEVIQVNKEAVIQDMNSQRVGELLVATGQTGTVRPVATWDCCAASGGKSIMAKDVLGNINLTVSDIRESILINLKKRFAEAGITNYKSFVADISKQENLPSSFFDIIIADVPCTGSGTWGRTPEQLYYFDTEKAEEYAALQKRIAGTAVTHLQNGGYFLYITCSVFKKENEEAVDYLKEKFHLQLVKMEVLKGYDKKADTMFAALLQRPL